MKNKILSLRLEKGLTQKEIACILGITTSYLGMIEKGVRKPSLDLAYKISNLFKTTIEDIFFAN
ncbi:helix-turn-helix transcriptional regulator [Clostridium perfringens]|uniref:helix-turn-helix transcriptional regulator n=1 Tax=Clostridium perfringens TaxID=1502 RepID=UPI001CAC0990|nr:helix-turn-helix domain-containing protein [Clostridium perfringens]HBI7094634.1 helix-turn-helix domain-containing protein [Clostridium perfringens]